MSQHISRTEIEGLMAQRILILDGAAGTYLQAQGFKEGCGDLLCQTRPDLIERMHREYIAAGADIVTTNSFNCNRFSLADYGLEERVYELAHAAARCARRAIAASQAERRIIVAGSMGPTNRAAGIAADTDDAARRDVTFGELYATYRLQAQGLWEGGADVLLLETVFDTLNAKAALKAIADLGKELGEEIPIMLSATLSDASGRTLSGQTVEALWASVAHAPLLSIGLNCGCGARQLLPWVSRLAEVAEVAVSVHPNAGLPNVMGTYDETPETFAAQALAHCSTKKDIHIYGGCCGTTPAHIKALAEALHGVTPPPLPPAGKRGERTLLSGLEALRLTDGLFINVGERTNVAGSAKFKRLIKEGAYDEALTIAREQVENGAQVIDICMDDGLIDAPAAMTRFLNLLASEPETARVPLMLDSSDWEVLCAGMACMQGKGIVNSISLKEGTEAFLAKARHIRAMGFATVVMLFDEEGQADTYERKVAVARRAYQLLRDDGFPTCDILFDPNVLAVATGMAEHNDYARAFIEACRTIRREMPEVHLSGGISNLSFAFRGNNPLRQAMHSVFLYHARQAGLDMCIVNPALTVAYTEIPDELLRAVEDVILNRDAGAAERLMAYAQQAIAGTVTEATPATDTPANRPALPLKERMARALLRGETTHIADDAEEAYHTEGSALRVIAHYLMPAMEQVGRLFGEGKMFLPQVVKSARVMKLAVARLEPYMQAEQPDAPEAAARRQTVVMATVKGDVHDIGKNIAGVVTQCNGYAVNDLGVMVSAEAIADAAQACRAVAIGLSGLITPSLEEMRHVLQELHRRGMRTPVLVGGATTSELHTALKLAPEYPEGVVIRAKAAADNPTILQRLLSADGGAYQAAVRREQERLRKEFALCTAQQPLLSPEEARRRRVVKLPTGIVPPPTDGETAWHIPRADEALTRRCLQRMDWPRFFSAWELRGTKELPAENAEADSLYADACRLLPELLSEGGLRLQLYARIIPACADADDILLLDPATRATLHRLPMPRSLRDEAQTQCLADRLIQRADLSAGESDYLCPFVVSAGVGLARLQARYRAEGDEYRALMAKLLADRLAEALAETLSELLTEAGWGTGNRRYALGYPACPDHTQKHAVFSVLGITPEESGLSLTETAMITPAESVCGVILATK